MLLRSPKITCSAEKNWSWLSQSTNVEMVWDAPAVWRGYNLIWLPQIWLFACWFGMVMCSLRVLMCFFVEFFCDYACQVFLSNRDHSKQTHELITCSKYRICMDSIFQATVDGSTTGTRLPGWWNTHYMISRVFVLKMIAFCKIWFGTQLATKFPAILRWEHVLVMHSLLQLIIAFAVFFSHVTFQTGKCYCKVTVTPKTPRYSSSFSKCQALWLSPCKVGKTKPNS